MVDANIWNDVLDIIKDKVMPVTYSTWFQPTKLYSIDNSKIIIEVPFYIYKKMFQSNESWTDLIQDGLKDITKKDYELDFIVKNEIEEQITINEISEEIEENNISFKTNLKNEFTFDNFVVGETNNFAKTAALAVAENPGKIYNPLFIYGKAGVGKTHLMHAIGNYINNNSNLKVLYTTSDEFRDDFTSITSNNNKEDTFNKANLFKNKYRDIDVLIIDDIQFLVGAEKTQQEFFHTFEYLHSKNKQIIISSDSSPDDLKLIEERLKSRFAWGLPVDIYPPDYDLRCRIIKDKIKNLAIKDIISEEVIDYIANTYDTDIRRIEGVIRRLMLYTSMYLPEKIDLKFALDALGDFNKKDIYSTSSIGQIQKCVADYYGITVDVLKSKKRTKNIAYPRMIAMYLTRMLTDESYPRIGLEFGGRDHSTVVHAFEKISSDLKNNKKLEEIINEIKSKV